MAIDLVQPDVHVLDRNGSSVEAGQNQLCSVSVSIEHICFKATT